MSVSVSEKRAVIREHNRALRDYSRRWRAENDAIFNSYMKAVGSGQMEEEFLPSLCKKYGCTTRRIRNVLLRKTGSLNPRTQNLTEANLVLAFQRMSGDLEVAKEIYESDLAELELLESKGHDTILFERLESIGGRGGNTVADKSIAIKEARYRLLEKINRLHEQYWSAVSRIIPKKLDIRTQNLSDISEEELQVLEEEIDERKKDLGLDDKND